MSTIQQQLQMLLQQQKALNLAVQQCAAAIESQGESTKADLHSLISGAMINEITLQDHTIATMPDHFKEQYVALLIHALKTATPLLSEAQYTLLGLLLRSMKLPQKNSAYFESSQEINSDFLLSFKKENTSDSAASFMMDLMLIARIPGNFSAQSLQLFSQLSELLGLAAKQLREIDEWCAYLLGLSDKVSIRNIFIYSDVPESQKFGRYTANYQVVEVYKNLFFDKNEVLFKYDIDQIPAYLYSGIMKTFGGVKKDIQRNIVLKPPKVPGYFTPVVNVGDRLSAGKRCFGYYYPLPKFSLFWFSFIDFDALIQGQ